MGMSEGKERGKGAEKLFWEIRAENFPILGKETEIQIQEAKRTATKSPEGSPHQDR